MFMPANRRKPNAYEPLRRAAVAALALGLLIGGSSSSAWALPNPPSVTMAASAQNVDWMSADTAASLDIGMDVMVPSWIPEPFSGIAPSVTASGGYYQLYWMISGGSPTFLYVEGTVGGSMPAGSPADLNKQLSINASVQGWDAIQDTGMPAGSDTPIYDQVWWIANGVLYTVSSNNMTGSDSLSLANSLVVLVPPAPEVEEPEVPTEPPYVPPTEPAPAEDDAVIDDPVEQQPAANDVEVTTEPRTVDTGTVSEPRVVTVPKNDQADSSTSSTESSTDSNSGTGGDVGSGSVSGKSGPWSPDRYDQNVPSDGTSGPLPPVIGGDGTGGPNDLSLPNILFRP